MTNHVAALFYDMNEAEGAVKVLVSQGIALADISLVLSNRTASRHFASSGPDKRRQSREGGDRILESLADDLVSAAAGSIGILATGPIMAALAAKGTDAFVGGMSAGLCGLGIPAEQAAFYENEIRGHDAMLVGVTTGRHHPARVKAYLQWRAGVAPPGER